MSCSPCRHDYCAYCHRGRQRQSNSGPMDMQWLKTLNIPFAGRLYPVSHGRFGVVHHHRVVSMAPAYPASRLRSSKKTRCRFVPSSKKQNSCLKSAVTGRPLLLGRIDPKSRFRWGLIFVEERYRLKSAKPPRPVSQSKVVATASICSSQRLNLRLEFGILITTLWVTAWHRLFTPLKY